MVSVVQLVERQIVVLVVVGSSPTVHPAKRVSLRIDSFFVRRSDSRIITIFAG